MNTISKKIKLRKAFENVLESIDILRDRFYELGISLEQISPELSELRLKALRKIQTELTK